VPTDAAVDDEEEEEDDGAGAELQLEPEESTFAVTPSGQHPYWVPEHPPIGFGGYGGGGYGGGGTYPGQFVP
jgi:hypothetical protein